MTLPTYIAYGSNLNKGQMKFRCPDSKPIATKMLNGYRLVFRPVADIIPADGYKVPVGLWRITQKCQDALDRYEGYPSLYYRSYLNDGETRYMTYRMHRQTMCFPMTGYLRSIEQGYYDFGMDRECFDLLEDAVKYSTKHSEIFPEFALQAE